jgi:arylsulfatase A-like enzyme
LQATEKYLSRFNHIQNPKRKTYAAMVSAVDDGVGTILNKLQELNIANNTIVIFLSDNGGPENDNGSDNGPLRGGKGSMFEGGIRVPFAIQWPQHIKANSTYQRSIISLDIFATVAANVSGIKTSKNKLDGVDLLPYLMGTKKGSPHEYLFWRNYNQKNYAVVHQSGLKEVILKDSSFNLYNLKNDIGEQTNVDDKKRMGEFEQQRKNWEAQTIAPLFYGLNQEEKYNEEKKSKQKQ